MAYQKQTWNNYNDSLSIEKNKANKAFATAEGLNHIEDGIKKVDEEVGLARGTHNDLSQRLTSTDQNIADMAVVNIKDFGAKGDGTTNDTLAIQQAAKAFNLLGGGRFLIPAGKYVVGKQTFAGMKGKGYAYLAEEICRIEGCTRPVIIEGSGAEFIAEKKLRFGSFNPITGEVYSPSMPFVNSDYRADAYPFMIGVYNNKSVVIKDLYLKGNIEDVILGGEWGDQGRQCKAYGIVAINNENLVIENVKSNYHALDGILIGYNGLNDNSDSKPMMLNNVECLKNARQGFTWDSGNKLTVINSKFNEQGRGRFSTSPSAGVDIETGNGNICRNGLFINCEFNHNLNNGMVSFSGDISDVTFENCIFWGTSGSAIYPNKPNFKFRDCKIFGTIQGIYSAKNEYESTKFIDCEMEDKNHPIFGSANTDYLIKCLGDYAVFKGCDIVANNCRSFFIGGEGQKLEDVTVTHKAKLANNEQQCLVNNAFLKNVTFKEKLEPSDKNNYYISHGAKPITESVLVIGPQVLWAATSPNGGMGNIFNGNVGYNNHNDLLNYTYRGIGLAPYKTARSSEMANLIVSEEAKPTTGRWNRGDRVLNSRPWVGEPKGWVCTQSGTPGTWVSEGNL